MVKIGIFQREYIKEFCHCYNEQTIMNEILTLFRPNEHIMIISVFFQSFLNL